MIHVCALDVSFFPHKTIFPLLRRVPSPHYEDGGYDVNLQAFLQEKEKQI